MIAQAGTVTTTVTITGGPFTRVLIQNLSNTDPFTYNINAGGALTLNATQNYGDIWSGEPITSVVLTNVSGTPGYQVLLHN